MSSNRLEFVTEGEILIVWVVSVIGWLGCRWSRMFNCRCRAIGTAGVAAMGVGDGVLFGMMVDGGAD